MDAEKLICDILNKYYIPKDDSIVSEKLKSYASDGVEGKAFYDECLKFVAIYWLKKILETETDRKLVEKAILQIIVLYLELRDFVNAFYYMEIYVGSRYSEADRINRCRSELEDALRSISDYAKKKNQNNIILYLLDALDYIDYHNISFLDKRSKDCLVLDYSFTVTPYTSSSIRSMFCHEKVIENEFYKKGLMDENNSILLSELKKRNYDFLYLSPENKYLFADKYATKKGRAVSASLLNWMLIREICDAQRPTVFLCHEIYSTHPPFIGGTYKGDEPIMIQGYDYRSAFQKKSGHEYISGQMEFLYTVIDDSKIDVYMSDHGGAANNADKYHTTFMVRNGKLSGNENRLFSYYDFSQLICALIDDSREEYNKAFSDLYVSIEDEDYYNYSRYVNSVVWGFCDLNFLMAYRGVHTKDGVYLKRRDGKTFYHRVTRNGMLNSENLINEMPFEEKAKLDKAAGDFFADMNNDHLKWAKVVYEYAVPNYRKRIKEIRNKLTKTLKQLLSSNKVAIRGGGKHTEELLKLINGYSNIVCIIDNNKTGDINGIPICAEKDIHQYLYDFILISSYKFRNEFIKGCRQYCKSDQIIDLYYKLEERGYNIHQNFFGDEKIEVCDFYGSPEADQMKRDIIKQMENMKEYEKNINSILS